MTAGLPKVHCALLRSSFTTKVLGATPKASSVSTTLFKLVSLWVLLVVDRAIDAPGEWAELMIDLGNKWLVTAVELSSIRADGRVGKGRQYWE